MSKNDDQSKKADASEDLNKALEESTQKLTDLQSKLETQESKLFDLEDNIEAVSSQGPADTTALDKLKKQKQDLENEIKSTLAEIDTAKAEGDENFQKLTDTVEQPSLKDQESGSERLREAVNAGKKFNAGTMTEWQSVVRAVDAMCDQINNALEAKAAVKKQLRATQKQANSSIRAANSVYDSVNKALENVPDVKQADLKGKSKADRKVTSTKHFMEHTKKTMQQELEKSLTELKGKSKGLGKLNKYGKEDYAALATAVCGSKDATEKELAQAIIGKGDKPLLNPRKGQSDLEKKILQHMTKHAELMKKAADQGGDKALQTRQQAEAKYGTLARLGKALDKNHQIMEKKCKTFCENQEKKYNNASMSAKTSGTNDSPAPKPGELCHAKKESINQYYETRPESKAVFDKLAGAKLKGAKSLYTSESAHALTQKLEKQQAALKEIKQALPQEHPLKGQDFKLDITNPKTGFIEAVDSAGKKIELSSDEFFALKRAAVAGVKEYEDHQQHETTLGVDNSPQPS